MLKTKTVINMALLLPHKIHKKAHTGLSKKIDKKKRNRKLGQAKHSSEHIASERIMNALQVHCQKWTRLHHNPRLLQLFMMVMTATTMLPDS